MSMITPPGGWDPIPRDLVRPAANTQPQQGPVYAYDARAILPHRGSLRLQVPCAVCRRGIEGNGPGKSNRFLAGNPLPQRSFASN